MTTPYGPPPRRRRGLLVGGAVAAVVVVAAAAVVALVLPRPAPPTPRAAPPAPAAPVDVTDADPCSLLDPAPLQAFGVPTVDEEFGEYAACQITLNVPSGGFVLVTAGFRAMLTAGTEVSGARETRGELVVGREAETDGYCDRTIQLPDRTRVLVTATDRMGADTLVCTIAETATASALARIEGSGLTERTGTVAPNSLADVDACTLLDPAALATVPALAGAAPEPGFADLSCNWGERPFVNVFLSRQEPVSADDGTPTVLAGRDALVLPGGYGGGEACLVQVLHREFTTASGAPRVEKVQVVYTGTDTDPPDLACGAATQLAAAVATRMPPL